MHPLTQAAGEGLAPAEWSLLIFAATVAAPVIEELLFRGLLQPWFASHKGGGYAAFGAAFAWAAYVCRDRVRAAWPLGVGPILDAAAPVLFVLSLLPILFIVVWRSRTPAGPAILGTAVLFAAIHSSVWPSPVALLLLALGLGGLAWRTRSLAGPILMHSLFNSVSVVRLLWS
jgi:membrane protease YdiL (CAAX protease family)